MNSKYNIRSNQSILTDSLVCHVASHILRRNEHGHARHPASPNRFPFHLYHCHRLLTAPRAPARARRPCNIRLQVLLARFRHPSIRERYSQSAGLPFRGAIDDAYCKMYATPQGGRTWKWIRWLEGGEENHSHPATCFDQGDATTRCSCKRVDFGVYWSWEGVPAPITV